MNKKSQVPTLLIFVIALILSGVALFAMVSFNNRLNRLDSSSSTFSELHSEIEFNQQYVTEQAKLITEETISTCPDCSSSNLKTKFKEISAEKESLYRYEGSGNFYGKIRNSEFEITSTEKNSYQLIINNLFVQSKKDSGKIIRNFALCLEFNYQGNFIKSCQEN
ncbi:hypothetical protein HYV50_01130 [Candidatus Pacearchaeota archaeon]|nr:hypothetical protein [Candidatus Pacearchaeota archaeon]